MARDKEEVIDDSKLRKVSISTNNFLFEADGVTVNQCVFDLLKQLKNRYRIYLMTMVDKEDGE